MCGADCPVVVLYRVSWPDQQIARGTLATFARRSKTLRDHPDRLVLVGRALEASVSLTADCMRPITITFCARRAAP